MDPIVYIPHLPTRQNPVNGDWVPTISLNPAAELGEIKVACDHPSDAAPDNFLDSLQRITSALHEITAQDYIIMTGDPVLCAGAIHVALGNVGKANVLRWNRENRAYDLLIIEDHP
jgi:hypothetical protein